MKKSILLILILITYQWVSGQDIEYAKEIVKTLSSPAFKGRGYVENGDKIAAKYISNQYSTLGLKSFTKNYYQYFKIDVNTFPSNMKLQFNGKELIPGEEFMVDAESSSLKGEFPIILVEEQDLLDDDKLRNTIDSCAGKVLIIDESKFESTDNEIKTKLKDLIKYLKFSPEVPSVATIIYTNQKLMWRGLTYQEKKPAFTVKKDLDLKKVKKVAIDVKARFVNYKTQNVVGYIEGTEKPDSFFVLIGHYDHLGKMGTKAYFPGANDNASGVAMLLNLAKYYAVNPPKYSIAFIALSAEEIGILGSKNYVENPLFNLGKIRFLVNLDMVGTGEEGIKVVNGSVYQDKFDLLCRINKENNYLPSVNIRGAACNSDHCRFYEKGVPSFYIYTMGGVQSYHDLYDKFETLPMTEFSDYSKLMIDFFNHF